MAHQIPAEQVLAGGMKHHRVHIQFVPREFGHGLAVGHIPNFHHAVIAAAGEQRAVRAHGDGANPTLVRGDFANGFGLVRRHRPPNKRVVKAAGHQCFTVLGKRQPAYPRIVPFENDFAAVGEFPANDGTILSGGKEILAGGIESAIDQRRGVRQ